MAYLSDAAAASFPHLGRLGESARHMSAGCAACSRTRRGRERLMVVLLAVFVAAGLVWLHTSLTREPATR